MAFMYLPIFYSFFLSSSFVKWKICNSKWYKATQLISTISYVRQPIFHARATNIINKTMWFLTVITSHVHILLFVCYYCIFIQHTHTYHVVRSQYISCTNNNNNKNNNILSHTRRRCRRRPKRTVPVAFFLTIYILIHIYVCVCIHTIFSDVCSIST